MLKWLANNKITAQVQRFTGYKQMMQALDKGELDAIATPDLATSYDYLPIINIGFSDYFFAVAKNRPDLLKELNEALFEIQSSEIDYNFNLVARYHTQMSNALLLNEKEKAWLSKHDNTIRVGFLQHSLPYSGQRDGQLVGIMDTIGKTLSKEFGIIIENKGYTTSEQLMDAIRQGDVDIAGPAYSDFYLAEQNDFVITSAMLSTTPVLVYKGNNPDISMQSIAVADTSLFQKDAVGVLFPNAKTQTYKTQMDCLQAVASGRVGSFITTSSSLNTYRKYSILERLQSAEIARKAEICLFTNKPNRTVASILNKGISLSSNVLNGSVLMENAYADRKITLKGIVQEYTTLVFAIVGMLFAVLGGGLYYLYRTKNELQQALVDVENANKAKTTFLNHMSHDIRTPMNAIIGFTNIAMKQKPTGDIQKCLEKIEESSEHLLALINDVLDISRLESGRVKYKPVPVDITKIVDMVINITQGFMMNRKLEFIVHRQNPPPPFVMADTVRVRDVLVNILSNAVKYTDDGGTITFDATYRPGADDKHILVRYSIADTGVGMSKEFMDKLFDEFSQEENSARTNYVGTGLGMAITKRYVDMMGGSISVSSEKGKGSTFVVELPMELTTMEANVQKDVPLTKVDLHDVHALMAEDNDLNAEIAIYQLEKYGMRITRVENGTQAVKAFAESAVGEYDLILMDIMMPEMNGYDATRAIRAMHNRVDAKKIPIIAMTANAFAEDVQASLDAGMNAHIAKPLIIEEAVKIIHRNLK